MPPQHAVVLLLLLPQGVGALLLDEFHERSLDADTSLALALDCQAWARPDLRWGGVDRIQHFARKLTRKFAIFLSTTCMQLPGLGAPRAQAGRGGVHTACNCQA